MFERCQGWAGPAAKVVRPNWASHTLVALPQVPCRPDDPVGPPHLSHLWLAVALCVSSCAAYPVCDCDGSSLYEADHLHVLGLKHCEPPPGPRTPLGVGARPFNSLWVKEPSHLILLCQKTHGFSALVPHPPFPSTALPLLLGILIF